MEVLEMSEKRNVDDRVWNRPRPFFVYLYAFIDFFKRLKK